MNATIPVCPFHLVNSYSLQKTQVRHHLLQQVLPDCPGWGEHPLLFFWAALYYSTSDLALGF